MRCYYHPDRPGVGLCKHCQRGLCVDCGALVDDVMACKDRHEAQVRQALDGQRRTELQSRGVRAGYSRNAVFYGLVGSAFSGFGLLEYRFLGWQAALLLLIGLFLIYAAIANFLEGRKLL